MSDTEKKVRDDEKQEISDEEMESVSGGVIDNCIPPIFDPIPTYSVDR